MRFSLLPSAPHSSFILNKLQAYIQLVQSSYSVSTLRSIPCNPCYVQSIPLCDFKDQKVFLSHFLARNDFCQRWRKLNCGFRRNLRTALRVLPSSTNGGRQSNPGIGFLRHALQPVSQTVMNDPHHIIPRGLRSRLACSRQNHPQRAMFGIARSRSGKRSTSVRSLSLVEAGANESLSRIWPVIDFDTAMSVEGAIPAEPPPLPLRISSRL